MTRFISNEYKTNLADLFVSDVLSNDYYLFVSTIDSETILANTTEDKKEFLRKTLFGKRIKDTDVFFGIKNYPWQAGEFFDQYDDTVDLTDKKFFTVVYPEDSNTGDYLVFKCLYNNSGGAVGVPPIYNENIADQIYFTSDGYIWKFMYSITPEDFDQYITYGYVPVIEPESYPVDDNSITHIEVENIATNYGYNAINCTVVGVDNQEIRIVPSSNSTLSEFENFYRGQTFYVTGFQSVETATYEILTYRWDSLNNYGVITFKNANAFGLLTYGSVAVIYPRIEIIGNGSGAVAIPVINDSNQIQAITLISGGTGYTQATARVVDPEFDFTPDAVITTDERAIIRVVLSSNGHGQDIKKELHCNSVILHARVTEADNIGSLIPTSGTYARLGIVKNPEFKVVANTSPDVFDNRISVDLTTTSDFLENDIATQLDPLTNETVFSSIVQQSFANTVYLAEYMGPYQNSANTDVSFDPDLPLRDQQNNLYIINNHTLSNYVQRTGEVIYVASFTTPITRSFSSTEQFKIILQF